LQKGRSHPEYSILMNISSSDKNVAKTSQRKKRIPVKTITWRNNKNICKSTSQKDLPINVKRKNESLGEANFMH
jgi:hypothetical protein